MNTLSRSLLAAAVFLTCITSCSKSDEPELVAQTNENSVEKRVDDSVKVTADAAKDVTENLGETVAETGKDTGKETAAMVGEAASLTPGKTMETNNSAIADPKQVTEEPVKQEQESTNTPSEK